MIVPMQKIFFGPPGCGKSFYVRQVAINDLKIAETPEALENNPNMIETTFHPEYGYGDFVAKLLPQTGSRTVAYKLDNSQGVKLNGTALTQTTDTPTIEYRIHAGPLIKALARAYANPGKKVLLVIDEINRGNCAQIFGDIFQSLDRDHIGWSEYGIDPSDLAMDALLSMFGKEKNQLPKELEIKGDDGKVTGYKLRLPPNLSLIGTMNTSDESVYYMDTAFKRRWDFEFMSWEGMIESQNNATIELQKNATIKIGKLEPTWHEFLEHLNAFIADKFKGRNVDDKQVGIWFLKALNLPQSTTRGERRVVLSVKQVELLKKLCHLYEKESWKDWKQIIPEGEKVSAWEDAKPMDAQELKSILKKHYEIDCKGTISGKTAGSFAKIITDYIFDKNPTTHDDVKLEVIEAHCNGEPEIELSAIKNKLMFFLWDNVFSRDRKPLYDLLKKGGTTKEMPRTFGAFSGEVDAFIKGVMPETVAQ